MSRATTMSTQTNRYVRETVATSLQQESRSGLAEVLRCIARSAGGFGCILWQMPASQETSSGRRLFATAEWFPATPTSIPPDLPVASATPQAALSGETVSVNTMLESERQLQLPDPLLSQQITAMGSVPVTFPDGARGALNVYKNDSLAFSPTEVERSEQLGRLVPELDRVIQQRVSLKLLNSVNEIG